MTVPPRRAAPTAERGLMTSWSGETFLVWSELTQRERTFMLNCRALTPAQRAEVVSFARHLKSRAEEAHRAE